MVPAGATMYAQVVQSEALVLRTVPTPLPNELTASISVAAVKTAGALVSKEIMAGFSFVQSLAWSTIL